MKRWLWLCMIGYLISSGEMQACMSCCDPEPEEMYLYCEGFARSVKELTQLPKNLVEGYRILMDRRMREAIPLPVTLQTLIIEYIKPPWQLIRVKHALEMVYVSIPLRPATKMLDTLVASPSDILQALGKVGLISDVVKSQVKIRQCVYCENCYGEQIASRSRYPARSLARFEELEKQNPDEYVELEMVRYDHDMKVHYGNKEYKVPCCAMSQIELTPPSPT